MASVTLQHGNIELLALDDVRWCDDVARGVLFDRYPVG